MDIFIYQFLNHQSLIFLFIVIGTTLFTLSKGADILVDEAVSLSIHWGIPKMIIGATIVSLGTTLPEATVSVFAAIKGNPDLALGNAIGSIIADTGLIIGLAALIGALPVDQKTINRQGRLQLAAGVLLSVACLPQLSKGPDGYISQWMGIVFLGLLLLYLYAMIKWAKTSGVNEGAILEEQKKPIYLQVIKLIIGISLIILSSKILIPSVEITALRIGIPQSVIAATLVAFGTSLPELVTAITAVKKGHGELVVGNIIGADILNVLFVVGASASVTSAGLIVPRSFYHLQIPAMLIILFAFRFFAKNKKALITKLEGFFLLTVYVIYLILNYL